MIATLDLRYDPANGLRLGTGDLNYTNQVYPFFDKENKLLNPHRDSKIPYLPSYHVEMRNKGEALFVEDGNFKPFGGTQTWFNYANVHNINPNDPDNGFNEIHIQFDANNLPSGKGLSIVRQCGDGRWIAWKADRNGIQSWYLFQNWQHITTANPIQSYDRGNTWGPLLPLVCGPNTCIDFSAQGYNGRADWLQVHVTVKCHWDENYVDTTTLTPAGVCDAYIEKIRTGKKACQQINHKGEFYSGSAHIYYMNENKFAIDIFQQTQEQLSAAF